MKLLERILVATDCSAAADDALALAVETAKRFESTVILLHVTSDEPADVTVQDLRTQAARERLEGLAERVRAAGVAVRTAVEIGSPYDRTVRFADRQRVNMIFIGASGAAEAQPGGLGIVAERIVQRARKPVCVVKPGAAPRIGRLLCAMDYSDSSCRGFAAALRLARAFEADLHVLHVVQPLVETLAQTSFAGDTPAGTLAEVDGAEEHRLQEFLRQHDLQGVAVHAMVRTGKPHQQILAAVKELGADLLVLGAMGRSALTRLLMGSVTNRVLRAMPCTMIAVKAENLIHLEIDQCLADLKSRLRQGQELLEQGFAEQAQVEFEHCLELNPCYPPTWDRLAEAHQRLGNAEEAQRCRLQARELVESLWNRRIEAELRGRYPRKQRLPKSAKPRR